MDNRKRTRRTFSEAFKKEKVGLILSKKAKVSEISKIYNVSNQAVYNWLYKYGHLPKGERMVIEKESEGAKTLSLLQHIKKLEAALGRKDLENTYLRTVLDKASEHFKCDIEKKFDK